MMERVTFACGHVLEMDIPTQDREKIIRISAKRLCPDCYIIECNNENRKRSEGCTLGIMDMDLYKLAYKDCNLKKFPTGKPADGKAHVFIPFKKAAAEAIITIWGTDRTNARAYDAAYERACDILHQDLSGPVEALDSRTDISDSRKESLRKIFAVAKLYQDKMEEIGTPVKKTPPRMKSDRSPEPARSAASSEKESAKSVQNSPVKMAPSFDEVPPISGSSPFIIEETDGDVSAGEVGEKDEQKTEAAPSDSGSFLNNIFAENKKFVDGIDSETSSLTNELENLLSEDDEKYNMLGETEEKYIPPISNSPVKKSDVMPVVSKNNNPSDNDDSAPVETAFDPYSDF